MRSGAALGAWGSGLALAVGVLAQVVGGPSVVSAALGGALLAGVAQGVAVRLLRPVMAAPTADFMRRWVAGMAVRGAATLALVAVMVVVRDRQMVLWLAAGFFAVLLPLLFVETRFLR